MKIDIRGKKLLILGATANEIPLVERAQQLGVYVIVTDYNLDHKMSPAKDVANEYWDISWFDVENLAIECRRKSVDGVIAGYSEIRVSCMLELTKVLGLPSYINEQQLEVTRNKELFKRECRKYGVPTIREYRSINDVNNYPVIVKPVDRAGSIGVVVANNFEELKDAYNYAMSKSLIGNVIIEDYITDATEMDAHYAISEGKITLLCTDDIIPSLDNQKEGKVIQSAWMYPSKCENEFLKLVDNNLRAMIKGMGIRNGTIFFSGFSYGNNFSFFECGFRLWGEQEFKYDNLKGYFNYLDIYIIFSLLGNTKGISYEKDSIDKRLKSIAVNIYSKTGTINNIVGIDRVKRIPACELCIIDAYEGQKCDSSLAISPKIALIGFVGHSSKKLEQSVKELYECFKVTDKNGNNMIYEKIKEGIVENYWN